MSQRYDGRHRDEIRPVTIQRHFTAATPGSVLIQAGRTVILCTASIDATVPPWKESQELEPTGWVTAEYNMLPGSTSPRKRRDRTKVDGRTTEIQRLIGRSLRAVVDFSALGPRTITVDCDVLQADGGTRTLSITGGFVALADAINFLNAGRPDPRRVITDSVAAISAGIVDGEPVLDLDYREDSAAAVDMNVVMTGSGQLVEIQGTAEGQTFSRDLLNAKLDLADSGIRRLMALQREAMGADWPL